MAERQYDDAEVAVIFKRAAESEHSVVPAPTEGKGLTLAALQDIGREVGIPPEAIADAARSLEQGAGSATGIGVIALMGLGMFTAGAVRLPGWARLRKTQIEQVIARLTAAKTLPRDDSKTD